MMIENLGQQSYLHSLGQLQGRAAGVPYLQEGDLDDLQPALCPTVAQLPDKSRNSFQLGPHALKRGHHALKPDAGPLLPTLCPEVTTQDPQYEIE